MKVQITKDNKTALLFGASGLIGGFLLDFLLESESYEKVVSFGRSELDIKHPKLVQQIIDFSKIEEYRDLLRGDDLYSCLGTTMAKAGSKEAFRKVDYEYPAQIARIAAEQGVNQYLLVSSVGADEDSLFYYNQVKGELENTVKNLSFWAVHIFQPSVLIGERNENRWGEKLAGILGRGFDRLTGGLLSKYKPIEAEVVARAMLLAAQGLKSGLSIYPSHVIQLIADEEEMALTNPDIQDS